jgi:hypothetical protein
MRQPLDLGHDPANPPSGTTAGAEGRQHLVVALDLD